MKSKYLFILFLVLASCTNNQSKNYSYIGFVNQYYINNSNEVYIDLYFNRDSIGDSDYQNLIDNNDSLIYEDMEIRRLRIPNSSARKKIDFRGLGSVILFDKHHNKLTDAKFERVEYLEKPISSGFTAVYKVKEPQYIDSAVYCIGNLKDKIIISDYELFEDTLMTKQLLDKYKLTSRNACKSLHFSDKNKRSIISIINWDFGTLIVEREKDQYRNLFKSTHNENVYDIVFIPITRNGKPVILLKCIKPESDVEWETLLVFNGTEYISTDRQRLKSY